MKKSPKISVICAVYNAQDTIRRCLNSILTQSLKDIEILLINDGSTDNSGQICDEYATGDNRIRVIHKANEGVAATRQCGLTLAEGDYMIHIDPDDWIESNALELLYNAVTRNNTEIAICDWTFIGPNIKEIKHQKPSGLDSKSLLEGILNGHILGGVCNKLISRRLAIEGRFESEIDYCEDVLFLTKICSKKNIPIAYVDNPLYNYDKTDCSSITSGEYTRKKYNSQRKFYNEIIKVYPGITDYQKSIIIGELSLKAFANDILSWTEFYEHFHRDRRLIRKASINSRIKPLIYLSSIGLYPLCKLIHIFYIKTRNCKF